MVKRILDNSDAQSWYLLGRCYMSQAKYPKAYEAYQQAVYRDGRNPTFWCSIGVLYYQINQYRDALDAYSRAIRLNPYISEVWYDLGTLVRSTPPFSHLHSFFLCNNTDVLCSMNLATTRLQTPSTRTDVQPISIRTTCTSRRVCSCSRVARRMQTRTMPQCPRMSTLKLIRLLVLVRLQAHNGELQRPPAVRLLNLQLLPVRSLTGTVASMKSRIRRHLSLPIPLLSIETG